MSIQHSTFNFIPIIALGICFSYCAFITPALANNVLHGAVEEQDNLNRAPAGPSLSRTDINGNDHRSSDEQAEQPQFAPPSFTVESSAAPMPPAKRAFPLNAENGGDAFIPQIDHGQLDNRMQQQQPHQQTPNQFNSQDPDMAPDMQLAWDAWHKRVAAAVYQRYSVLSSSTLVRSGRPLQASASYVVTRDGRIINAQLLVPSSNLIYNMLILGVINSISGDLSVLAFPPGSHRLMVEKTGTFLQNCGNQGFKYLTGDRETIQQGQVRTQQ